ncbi:MAG: hypothetical protein ABI880_10430 [Acidobacteriota bacterium]
MSLSRLLVAIVAGLVAGGCGTSTPTGPSPGTGPLTGTWTGTLERPGAVHTVRLDLTDDSFGSGSIVSGRYTTSDASGAIADTGSVGGVVTNSAVSMRLNPSQAPPCEVGTIVPPGTVLMTLTLTGRQLSGNGVLVRCGDELLITASFSR